MREMNRAKFFFLCAIAASGVSAQTLKDHCDSARFYIAACDMDKAAAALQKVYGKFMDGNDKFFSISKELENLRTSDQAARMLLMDTEKRFGKESEEYGSVHKWMLSLDRKNTLRAKEVIAEYGWLSKEDVGEDAEEGLFLVVQHSKDSVFHKTCLEKLGEAVRQDKSIKWQYAFLVDRFAMNNGGRQVYGTQKIVVKGVPYLVPLENPRRVDALRRKMGMQSVWKDLEEDYGGKWSLKRYMQTESKCKEVYKDWFRKNRSPL